VSAYPGLAPVCLQPAASPRPVRGHHRRTGCDAGHPTAEGAGGGGLPIWCTASGEVPPRAKTAGPARGPAACC